MHGCQWVSKSSNPAKFLGNSLLRRVSTLVVTPNFQAHPKYAAIYVYFSGDTIYIYTLPLTNNSHLEIDSWKLKFPFGAYFQAYMWVFPKNRGTPKSSILIRCSIIFTIPFGCFPPILGNTHIPCFGFLFLSSMLGGRELFKF